MSAAKGLSPYLTELDLSNSPVWNFQFDELIFFPSLNWIFTTKIQFKLGKKSSTSNWQFQTGEFEKSSSDRWGKALPDKKIKPAMFGLGLVWAILRFNNCIIFFSRRQNAWYIMIWYFFWIIFIFSMSCHSYLRSIDYRVSEQIET